MKRPLRGIAVALGSIAACAVAVTYATPAHAAPVLDVGTHEFEPGEVRDIEIVLSDPGDFDVAGLELNVQIGDGGSPAGGDDAHPPVPRIDGVDLITGTIFEAAETANVEAVVDEPLLTQHTVDIEDEQGQTTTVNTDTAGGLIATVTIDATGAIRGNEYQFRLADVFDGFDTRFFDALGDDLAITITNGWIIIPGAEEIIWTAAGDGTLWSDADNWNFDEVDVDAVALDLGDRVLVFTGTGTTTDADAGDYENVGGLLFDEDAGEFTLTGGRLSFSDGAAIRNLSGVAQEIQNDLQVESGRTLAVAADDGNLVLEGAVALLDDSAMIVTGDDRVDIWDVISGDGTLIRRGAGALELFADNTYTGGTQLESGTIVANHAGALGTGALSVTGGADLGDAVLMSFAGEIANDLAIDAGSALTVRGDTTHLSGTITGDGDLRIDMSDAATPLELSSQANAHGDTYLHQGTLLTRDDALPDAGTVDLVGGPDATWNLDGDATIGALAGASGSMVDLDASTLTIAGDLDDAVFHGTITNQDGRIHRAGDGILTLTQANTYQGGTELEGGGILIGHHEALGTGAVDVTGNAMLGASAELAAPLANDIDINVDAVLTLGGTADLALGGELRGAGTLSFAGDVEYDLTDTDFDFDGAFQFAGGQVTFGEDDQDPTRQFVPASVRVTQRLDGNHRIGGNLVNEPGGIVSPGESIGTIVVDGDFTAEPGSSLWIDVRGFSEDDDENTQHADLLDVSGTATFQAAASDNDNGNGNGNNGDGDNGAQPTASTIRVAQLEGDDVPAVQVDDQFEVVRAGDGIEIEDLLIDSQIAGINFTWAIMATFSESLMLTAIQDALDFNALADGADRNTRRIARALESLEQELGQEDELIELLHEEFPGAVDDDARRRFRDIAPALGPQAYDAIMPVTVDNISQLNATLSRQLAARRRGLPAVQATAHAPTTMPGQPPMFAGAIHDPMTLATALEANNNRNNDARARNANNANNDVNDLNDLDGERDADRNGVNDLPANEPQPREHHGWSFFAQGVGIIDNQQTSGDFLGYRADSAGAMVGGDYEVIDDLFVGLSLSYLWTDVRLKSSRGEHEINTIHVGPYISYAPEPWFVDGSLTYGYHRFDSTREVPQMNVDADSKHDAHSVNVYAGGGYSFMFDQLDGFEVIPVGSLQYTHLSEESFRESGPGALEVDSRSSDSLRTRLGVQVRHVFDLPEVVLVPEASVGWEREWLSQDQDVRARFRAGGDPFTVRAGEPNTDAAFLGLGVTALFNEQWSAYLRYDGLYHGDGSAHAFTGGAGFRF